MIFSYQTYVVVNAIEKYLEKFKDNVELVGYADYEHFFTIYETLVRMSPSSRPTMIYLDVSELNALEEWM